MRYQGWGAQDWQPDNNGASTNVPPGVRWSTDLATPAEREQKSECKVLR